MEIVYQEFKGYCHNLTVSQLTSYIKNLEDNQEEYIKILWQQKHEGVINSRLHRVIRRKSEAIEIAYKVLEEKNKIFAGVKKAGYSNLNNPLFQL